MRNVFLTLILANLLLLAWQIWVDPSPPAPSVSGQSALVLFGLDSQSGAPTPGLAAPAAAPSGNCLRLGPMASVAASQQALEQLAVRGIDATAIARDTQVWIGHWVQIAGFTSVPDAEAARQRLVAGGLADAYLMQDGPQPMLSLGVFRDRGRADRVAIAAQRLGFQAGMRDRYRPTLEQWLLIHPRPNQTLGTADLSLSGDRIMRTEGSPCEAAVTISPPADGRLPTRQPQQPL